MTPGDDDHDMGVGAVERNSGASGPSAAAATAGADGVAEVAEVEASGPISAASAVDTATSVNALDEISAGLAAGSLSPAEAQSMLIDQVVAAQLPEGADPALLEDVRAEVSAALANDPVLASLLNPKG